MFPSFGSVVIKAHSNDSSTSPCFHVSFIRLGRVLVDASTLHLYSSAFKLSTPRALRFLKLLIASCTSVGFFCQVCSSITNCPSLHPSIQNFLEVFCPYFHLLPLSSKYIPLFVHYWLFSPPFRSEVSCQLFWKLLSCLLPQLLSLLLQQSVPNVIYFILPHRYFSQLCLHWCIYFTVLPFTCILHPSNSCFNFFLSEIRFYLT